SIKSDFVYPSSGQNTFPAFVIVTRLSSPPPAERGSALRPPSALAEARPGVRLRPSASSRGEEAGAGGAVRAEWDPLVPPAARRAAQRGRAGDAGRAAPPAPPPPPPTHPFGPAT